MTCCCSANAPVIPLQRLPNPSLACTKSRSWDGYAVFSSPLLALLHVVFVPFGACFLTMCCCKKSAVVNIFPHVKHECKFPLPSPPPGASRLPEEGAGRARSCSYLHGTSVSASISTHISFEPEVYGVLFQALCALGLVPNYFPLSTVAIILFAAGALSGPCPELCEGACGFFWVKLRRNELPGNITQHRLQ